MRTYIIRRLLLIIPTLFILTILVFLSVHFIPGDVIDAMLARKTWLPVVLDREALERRLCLPTCSMDAGSVIFSFTAL